jgi:hypothetical protein
VKAKSATIPGEAWVEGYEDLIPAMNNQEKDRKFLRQQFNVAVRLAIRPHGIALVRLVLSHGRKSAWAKIEKASACGRGFLL